MELIPGAIHLHLHLDHAFSCDVSGPIETSGEWRFDVRLLGSPFTLARSFSRLQATPGCPPPLATAPAGSAFQGSFDPRLASPSSAIVIGVLTIPRSVVAASQLLHVLASVVADASAQAL